MAKYVPYYAAGSEVGNYALDLAMTKILDSCGADRVGAGAPEDEMKITPEMTEAGIRVLWESGAIETPMAGADRELVQEIFLAMSHASKCRS